MFVNLGHFRKHQRKYLGLFSDACKKVQGLQTTFLVLIACGCKIGHDSFCEESENAVHSVFA